MPHVRPKCTKCGEQLYWDGYASMGGSHSNYYRCPKCDRVVEIYDRDLPYNPELAQKYKAF